MRPATRTDPPVAASRSASSAGSRIQRESNQRECVASLARAPDEAALEPPGATTTRCWGREVWAAAAVPGSPEPPWTVRASFAAAARAPELDLPAGAGDGWSAWLETSTPASAPVAACGSAGVALSETGTCSAVVAAPAWSLAPSGAAALVGVWASPVPVDGSAADGAASATAPIAVPTSSSLPGSASSISAAGSSEPEASSPAAGVPSSGAVETAPSPEPAAPSLVAGVLSSVAAGAVSSLAVSVAAGCSVRAGRSPSGST